jgi:hypothetical protein
MFIAERSKSKNDSGNITLIYVYDAIIISIFRMQKMLHEIYWYLQIKFDRISVYWVWLLSNADKRSPDDAEDEKTNQLKSDPVREMCDISVEIADSGNACWTVSETAWWGIQQINNKINTYVDK